LRRLAARFRDAIQRLGWVTGVVSVIADAVARLSGGRCRLVRYRLLVQPVVSNPAPVGRLGRGLRIREAERGDPVLGQMERPAATIASRFEQGARCLVALRGDELVGCIWWIEGPYIEDEVRCVFIPQPAGRALWDFDVYVAPAHRFGPAFARLWNAAIGRMRQAGFEWSCSRISAFNATSLRAHQRLGARVVGSRSYLCVGPLQLSLSRHPPRLHVSCSPASRPVVQVPPRGSSRESAG